VVVAFTWGKVHSWQFLPVLWRSRWAWRKCPALASLLKRKTKHLEVWLYLLQMHVQWQILYTSQNNWTQNYVILLVKTCWFFHSLVLSFQSEFLLCLCNQIISTWCVLFVCDLSKFSAENVKAVLKLYVWQAFENVYFFSKPLLNVSLVEGSFSVFQRFDVNVQV